MLDHERIMLSMEILAIIAFVAVIISHNSLSSRLTSLEAKLKAGEKIKEEKPDLVSAGLSNPNKDDGGTQPYLTSMAQPATQNPGVIMGNTITPQEPDVSDRFSAWIKEDWLMKLGAFLFIIGFGWFVSYAFANNWIGPVGRITIGIVAGAVTMILGFRRMMRYPSQGALFMALGAGMAMLTIFAGRSLYEFFTPISAIGFDFLIVAFVSFASYKFNVRTLAYTAQVLAFVAPLLTAGITDSYFLFSYLFFISLATLVLGSVTGWRGLIITSLVFVSLYSIPYVSASRTFYLGYGSRYSMDAPFILNFAYLFAMLYILAGMFAVVKKGVQNIQKEIVLAVLNGLFLFMWIYSVANKEWTSLLFAVWALVFAVSSFVASRFSAKLDPFYAYGSVAVAFVAAATAAQLNGTALTIAFAVEVFLLVAIVLALTKNVKAASTTSLLFIAPAIMSFGSAVQYMISRELFSKDFFVLILMAVLLIVSGRLITSVGKNNQGGVNNNAGSAIIILGTLYIWFTLWQFIHIFMRESPDIATMTTLIIFTVAGLTAYFTGLYNNDIARKVYGTALLAFVVVRLIIVDVWAMELFGRVITFFAIGVLFMSTAFLTKKRKQLGGQK